MWGVSIINFFSLQSVGHVNFYIYISIVRAVGLLYFYITIFEIKIGCEKELAMTHVNL